MGYPTPLPALEEEELRDIQQKADDFEVSEEKLSRVEKHRERRSKE